MQIKINWSQVITALIIGAITGSWALIRFSDSVGFIARANEQEINEIKEVLVPRPEYEAREQNLYKYLDKRFDTVESLIKVP